ncbi:MAG TPA: LamG domain-containing protein [Limnochordia bacterium]|nr:LamG domain-containing protein [Limnochordia bacterium]
MDKRYFVLVVLSLTLVFAAGLGAAAEKQPMIYYSFDEIQEDLVLDGSGNQRNALLEGGISWTADGYKGGALYFAGEDGFVRLPDNVARHLDSMTIALWVKLDSNPMWARVFDFQGSKGFMYLTLNSGVPAGGTRFSIYVGDPDTEPILTIPADTFELGMWYHIAVVSDAENYRFYVNGEELASLPVTHKPSEIGSDVVMANYLGKSQFEDPYFHGFMDEFYLFAEALSAEEVAALMTRSR